MDYESEYKELVKIHLGNREVIIKKHEDYYKTHYKVGLDGWQPDAEELKCESKRFWDEVRALKKKYNKV